MVYGVSQRPNISRATSTYARSAGSRSPSAAATAPVNAVPLGPPELRPPLATETGPATSPAGDHSARLSTSQFRRTLAWFIGRRPGGSIAGAIQYRHHSIQMFEGYAGTSDSGFRAEVEAEQSLERGERLLAMIGGHHHANLRGLPPKKLKRA
jgi:hypothetical protein